jgi:RNA polymerase sigma-70 factor, ECF subfamily
MGKSAAPDMDAPGDITRLLSDVARGDLEATDKLATLVYAHLREMAGQIFRRERPGHTLQPTALVHETFLCLMGDKQPSWKNRAHFFGIAAHAMRHILVEHARKTNAKKRGAGQQKLELKDSLDYSEEKSSQLEALDEALARLEVLEARQAKIVELRFFGGLSIKETCEVLGIKPTTVKDDWRLAKAWLRRELEP